MRKYYRKLLGFMVVAAAMTLSLFASNGWSSGTPRGFTVDFSNAAFSSVPGNALQMQSTGVVVAMSVADTFTGRTTTSSLRYTVIWEFDYSTNLMAIARAINTTDIGGSAGGGTNTGGGSTVTDVDGNVYNTVTIGTQTWMRENLKVTKYRDGTAIGTTTPATLDLSAQTSPKYQWAYNGDESNVSTYGRLYTWYAATDSRGLCPSGWHLPTDAEWTTLTTYLGGESVAGGHLKEAGTTHWRSPNTSADNSSGFTALPGGSRAYGPFSFINSSGSWWSGLRRTTRRSRGTAAWPTATASRPVSSSLSTAGAAFAVSEIDDKDS